MIKYLRFKTKFQIEELLEKNPQKYPKNIYDEQWINRVKHLLGKK